MMEKVVYMCSRMHKRKTHAHGATSLTTLSLNSAERKMINHPTWLSKAMRQTERRIVQSESFHLYTADDRKSIKF